MKILHFIYDHPENIWLGGGGADRCFKVAKRLAARGHEITIVCGAFPNCGHKQTPRNVEIIFRGIKLSYWMSRLFFSILARRNIDFNKYDLIIDDTSPFSFTMPYLNKGFKGPMIAIVHHLIGNDAIKKLFVLGYIFKFFEIKNIEQYSNIIVVSKDIKQKIQNIDYNKNIKVIYNGLEPINPDINIHKKNKKRRIISLGRLEIYHKGFDLAVQVFSGLKRKYKDLEWIIVGKGKDYKKIQKLIKNYNLDNVTFKGYVNDKEEKFNLLNESLLLLMPSRFEGWGITSLEAAQAKTVTVGFAIEGLREAVIHNQTGYLANPYDVEEMIHLCTLVIENEQQRKEMEDLAFERSKQFTWDKVADEHESIYKHVLELNNS